MKMGVVGAGAWGTALAQVLAAGGDTLLWAFEPDVADEINTRRENPVYLPGVPLSSAIRATSDLADMAQCEALLIVTPAQHVRRIVAQLPGDGRPLILCAKGIEAGSGKLMSQVVAEVAPGASLAVVSGRPSRMRWRRVCPRR